MRLDKLTLRNFRGFTEREFAFGPGFNLIVGENGSGKTTVLAAAAVALYVPVLTLVMGYEERFIEPEEVHRRAIRIGDSLNFESQLPSTANSAASPSTFPPRK